jgi:hypothetical protein
MSQHGRVTKPGRQRPRVPIDERLRAPRACESELPLQRDVHITYEMKVKPVSEARISAL